MPRIGRVVVPNMPHHVFQRGHNRNDVFTEISDYSYYLENLRTWARTLKVKVYAWCLMTNHVHLLLDPGNDVECIGLLMKRLAGKQTCRINKRELRTGSLWDGRYKMSIVDSDQYFIQCCRYIELNPIKGRIVSRPEDYRWSSYRENAGIAPTKIVNRTGFMKLCDMNFQSYQKFVAAGTDISEDKFISKRLESNRLIGGDSFADEIESRTGVRLKYNRPGRPKKY